MCLGGKCLYGNKPGPLYALPKMQWAYISGAKASQDSLTVQKNILIKRFRNFFCQQALCILCLWPCLPHYLLSVFLK